MEGVWQSMTTGKSVEYGMKEIVNEEDDNEADESCHIDYITERNVEL